MRLRKMGSGASRWRPLVANIVAPLMVAAFFDAIRHSSRASINSDALNQPESTNGVVSIPVVVRRVGPHFPRKAARVGLTEGMVVVEARIEVDGRPQDLQVLRADPPDLGFEGAAVRAVRKWRYEPGVLDGRPVAVYQIIRVDFHRGRPEP